MTTATFAIGGMHCASCAARNERALQKIPGVREANVKLGTRSARVEFDEAAVSEAALHEAIVENGYEVLVGGTDAHRQQARDEGDTARPSALLDIARDGRALGCKPHGSAPCSQSRLPCRSCCLRWGISRCLGSFSGATPASGFRPFSAASLFSGWVMTFTEEGCGRRAILPPIWTR